MSISVECLCGATELSVTPLSSDISACHCDTCRHWGNGGPFFGVDCGTAVELRKTDQLAVYDSSEWAERGFCQTCGTHMFYRLKEHQHYHLPAGLFGTNPDADVQPDFNEQIFIDQKPAWYTFANKTTELTGAEVFAEHIDQAENHH